MKDTPAFATNVTFEPVTCPQSDRSIPMTFSIWAQSTVTLWEKFLKRPFASPLDEPIYMQAQDTLSLRRDLYVEEKTFSLYLLLPVDRQKLLTATGTVCIDHKFYFFDPDEGEDAKLYEYSLDPAVLEPTATLTIDVQPESP